jgi:hypothetical protein
VIYLVLRKFLAMLTLPVPPLPLHHSKPGKQNPKFVLCPSASEYKHAGNKQESKNASKNCIASVVPVGDLRKIVSITWSLREGMMVCSWDLD